MIGTNSNYFDTILFISIIVIINFDLSITVVINNNVINLY